MPTNLPSGQKEDNKTSFQLQKKIKVNLKLVLYYTPSFSDDW